jgi:hypothetical protein
MTAVEDAFTLDIAEAGMINDIATVAINNNLRCILPHHHSK